MLQRDRIRLTVAAIAFFAVAASLAILAVPRLVEAVQSLGDEVEPGPSRPQGGASERDATPPVGLERDSLVLRGNLAPALRRLRARSAGGRVRRLRIAPDEIVVQVITADQRVRTLQHRHTGETQMLSDTSTPAGEAVATLGWPEIDASAPRRIAERVLRGRRAAELEALVLAYAGGPRWSVLLTTGGRFTADAEGRRVTPLGG